MADLEQRTLDGSREDDFFQVWAGKGENLQRLSNKADGLVVFTHGVNDAAGAWKIAIPQGVSSTQIVALLAALHDYCSQQNLVVARTWKLGNEKRGKEPGSTEIEIPLNDPNLAQKLQDALRPVVVKKDSPPRSAKGAFE